MSWIYEINKTNTARYVLGEINEYNSKTLICFGVNPSIASPDVLDNTILKVRKIAYNNNYSNWIMLNLYPQRATNPKQLDLLEHEYHSQANIAHIRDIILKYSKADILLAYGNLIDQRHYLKKCLKDILNLLNKEFKGDLYIIKMTKKGNPIHPLYQPNNSRLVKTSFSYCMSF